MSENRQISGVKSYFSGMICEVPQGNNDDYAPGDFVIFKDDEGKEEFGLVKYISRPISDEKIFVENSKILRKATANDVQKVENHETQLLELMEKANQLVGRHGLDMQVFRAGISFSGGKLHFMFTAEDRVDFRELVKDLAKVFKKQIYLRQVGPRDKAMMVGGFGKCGRSLCCNTFLHKLASINMEMVREQGLESKGSSKLSGACGKLLCCLRYEVNVYRDLKKGMPDVGSFIVLKKSSVHSGKKGKVIALDILNKKLKVILEGDEWATIELDDVSSIKK
ncbi:stage 0 sporulation protein [Patescibacteria group bacterium]|nr:stage 0 sporulation protein [Patescibacteria group bacterium]